MFLRSEADQLDQAYKFVATVQRLVPKIYCYYGLLFYIAFVTKFQDWQDEISYAWSLFGPLTKHHFHRVDPEMLLKQQRQKGKGARQKSCRSPKVTRRLKFHFVIPKKLFSAWFSKATLSSKKIVWALRHESKSDQASEILSHQYWNVVVTVGIKSNTE